MIRSLVTRRSGSAVAVVFAFALASASVAWGCASIQPKLTGTEGQTSSGPAASQVTITGKDFGAGPVEVRWNSKTGQLLGQAMGPNFSVSIKIPDAAVGVHHILASSTTARQTMPFEVTKSPTASPADSAPTSTGSTTNAASEDDSTSNSSQQATGTATSSGVNTRENSSVGSPATQSNAGSTATTPARSAPAQTTTEAPGATMGSAPAGSGATATAAATERRAASANPAVVTTPSGQAVFGGSAATASTAMPSAASVSGDTWSGFDTATSSLLLSDAFDGATTNSGPDSAPGLAVGLLGAGLVALLAGFAVAESARKRALAGAVDR